MLATAGDNCIDRYLAPVWQSAVGGNAVNVAVGLVAAGLPCRYFGAVGADAAGRRVSAELVRRGVGIDHLQRRPQQTAETDLGVDAAGERAILREVFGACEAWQPSPEDILALRAAGHVHLGWLADAAGLRAALAGADVRVSQDLAVALDEPAPGLDLAFASAGPDHIKARALLDALSARHAIAVVTCGAKGAVARGGGETVEVPALAASVVDTTGAGDAFIAGFIAAHHRGAGLAEAMHAGSEAGARACSHLAGFPQRTEAILST
ncbi:MAG: PfkB family carbohydrate kinase [Azospirillaceae bacterium]